MMKHLLQFYLLPITYLVLCSCSKNNLKAPEASFMVAYPSVNITSALIQGSNSQKITDMWLYVNDQFQGCYATGAVMPIVASGNAKVTFFAGIKNNGIADTRQPYYFYQSYTINQSIEAGKTYTVNPTFEYISSAKFWFADNFNTGSNGSGNYFTNGGDSAVGFNNPNGYGGSGQSVFMSMSDTKPTAKLITNNYYAMPLGGAAVYLEMDYQCNQPIIVGILSGTSDRQALVLNPTTGWNKIYVDLRTVINTQPISSLCRFYIAASKQTTTPQIYIDNVKLIAQY